MTSRTLTSTCRNVRFGPKGTCASLPENDRSNAIEEHAQLRGPANGTGQYSRFYIPPDPDQVLLCRAMMDALDTLLDDGPFIEVAGDEVRCCPNQLHAPFMRAAVGPCSLEAWQEAVVDIEAATGKLLGK